MPDRPLFTSRYGLRTHLDGWGKPAYASRHTHDKQADSEPWGQCERDQRLRCACPGSPQREQCCHRATQEDRLCDACRDWCVAVDGERVYHRLIDVYGAAS